MDNSTLINKLRASTIFFFLVMVGFKGFSQTPQVDGQWSDVIPFDIVPVAIANLPDGRILTWSSKSKFNFGGADGFTWTQIFDPSIGTDGGVLPEIVTNTNHDMFCPGINNLADGRILATGGSSAGKATLYDPLTETWTAAENMNYARGYQGAVTLSDGSVFTVGGSWSGGSGVKDAEIWTEETGWTVLPGITKNVLYNAQDDIYETQQGSYRLDNHAWLWAAPNGKIFHAGPGETMHWIDVTGNGSYTVVGQRGTTSRPDIYAMNGTTVMFDIGKILKFGGSYTYSGGTPSNDNAYVIDINDENNVTVALTGNDAEEGRIFPTGVVLPNGEVMIIGGMDTSVPFSDNGAHLSLEIYNPDTNLFRTVVDMDEARTYHSAGILMKDGRVFMGGGGLCGGCTTNHANAEIYSPPYLFDTNGDLAVRPTLSAPNLAYYDNTFSVIASPDVTDFAFIRLSSATHSVNNEQRRVPVTFTGTNGNFQLDMPNANIMPPGYYMLFAMNADGVPSISETVLVGNLNLEDNLALNQPTSQSSLYPNGESFKAVDGNTNGIFNANPNSVTHTGDGANQTDAWWRVDLGDTYEYDLNAIRVFNRTDCCTGRLDGATVYIGNIDSTNPADYTEVATLTADGTQVLTQNLGIARYVMIRQTGILSLAEVQVFGVGVNCPAEGTVCDDGDINTSNDIEDGNCNCAGTIISCDNIETVAQVEGESFSGETEISVTEDDDVTLLINLDDVTYTIEDPDGNVLGSNTINDIAFDQSGLYTFRSSINGPITLNPTLLYADSEHPIGNNGALNALDGNPNTFWHTEYYNANDNTVDVFHNHEIQLDLGVESVVSGLEYLPRQNGPNGRIADYEIYVSNDANNWGAAVNTGTWVNNNQLQTVNFTEKLGRYVRLVALSEVNGNPWTSVAEIDIIATGIVECVKTLQINVTSKPCEELAIIYEINGESGTGETEITVTEGDDIGLFLNSDIVTYTVEDPNAIVLPSNTINNISLGQSGVYTVRSTIGITPQNPIDPILIYYDSEELNAGNPASNAFDGDPNTIWHTEWVNANPPPPHEMHLDLGENSLVSGFTYLPRQAAQQNGRVADYEIYVSNSTSNWGAPISTGTWANDQALKTVNFPAVQARYLRFVALSEVNGNPWAAAAEIGIIRPEPTVYYVNSEDTGSGGFASNALDGDPNTIWHSQYSNNTIPDTPYPHEFQIDLGIESDVSGLEYLPRQAGINGTIADYEIYVSNDPNNWGTAISTGTWANSNALKTVSFPVTQGRYVRLAALSEVNGNVWASAAEINIVRTIPTECIKTIEINVDTVTNYTYNNGWSPSDPNNVSNFNDTILIEGGEAVISMNTISDIITVEPGAGLTINSGVTVSANTTTLKSTSVLYSSLIADGTIEGEVKYERFVNANSGGNDLISPPLAGQSWEDFLNLDNNATDLLNNGGINPTTYAFGPFDKTVDGYVNYTNAQTDLDNLNLVSGRGYRAATQAGTNLTFAGSVPTTSIDVNILDTGAAFPDWNLIGNPYPSYLDMDLFLNYVLDANTDPVTTNLSILEDISGIYGYLGNGTSNKWGIITLANASNQLMAPGQGFFVAANDAYVNDYNIVFDPSMRAIGVDDDFIAGRSTNILTYLKLNLGTSNEDYTTEFYFNDNASKGLDRGYDGKILGNVAPNFAIYSHLVEDNNGLPIALQALNPLDLVNTVIPLGVNSNQGEQITFSISETTLPSNVEVYLEDNVTNTITLLNSGDYTITPSSNLNGTGRFYLRVTSSILSVGQNELDYIQIYTTTSPKSLVLKGQLNADCRVSLYDIQGRLVLNESINHLETSNTIDISMIGSGVYFVKVFNDNQSKTQKIIIN
ncbi:discoidin domain-containing protein [Winogradskyella echinorum]|uniref:Discoidin domain-containing protein n=1 Tax=Winogradskyella echinorum TaxID=538189 RepID=A0ABR6Y218_9FLAO|nr:discoidin domain-containing protein [Winogradskyella echinorum]MBC3846765.1 discoidin domain-containing protein [Winogradskyella echinorum]MBC5751113.1 discoidin domain-containing protein [Winogradskyella echinorum]